MSRQPATAKDRRDHQTRSDADRSVPAHRPPDEPPDGAADDDVRHEQRHVTRLYEQLDTMRRRSAYGLATALRNTGGTQQERSQRDGTVAMYTEQITRLGAVEHGLCFGRLDLVDGKHRYIGRIGIFDEAEEYHPLLIDWRAPSARPFYLATAAAPDGVRRRRHIRTRERAVVALDDEILDLETVRRSGGHSAGARDHGLTGEAALLAAVTAERTGQMTDIVQTIQAEQDKVIRADLGGVLVVQGGPGTGKTAVALHRAAYLLYTHRQLLASRGVLIVGPNPTFLRYISHVLPSLAETGVLLRTLGDLFPGVTAERPEPAAVAEIKGRIDMTTVLAAAVRDRQRVPDEPLEVRVERDTLILDQRTCATARKRVRRAGRPHNLARSLFEVEIVHALAGQVAERIGADPLGGKNLLEESDLAEIRRELRAEPEVLAVCDWLWPVLTPQQLVAGLFASGDRLAAAAPELTTRDREMLLRESRGGFSPADVPLLDEAAELLGADNRAAEARAARHRRQRSEYAEGVLEVIAGSESIDLEDEAEGEILSATDLLDADALAERHDDGERLTTAQLAAIDRNWAFGHVIVDEAQELSPMAWRSLMRRCPSRSMTLVGDVAQTGALAGTSDWRDVLRPYVADRWQLAELTVNYRTPSEIMAVATPVLAGIDPTLTPPRSVRDTGVPPWDRRVPAERFAEHLIAATRDELGELTDGRLAILVPANLLDVLGPVVAGAVPGTSVGDRSNLENRVVVLTVAQAKGLEFDSVLVIDPDRIAGGSRRGRSDLYVALTRATQRLGVLRPG